MAEPVRVWIATNKNGQLLAWSVSTRRADAIAKACAGFLGCNEYLALGNDGARWKKVYRKGVRVRRAWIVLEEPSHD